MMTIQFLDFSILSYAHYLASSLQHNNICKISNVKYVVELDIMWLDVIVKTGAQFLMLF